MLEALLEHPRDSIRRLATGALVNVSEMSAAQEEGQEGEEEGEEEGELEGEGEEGAEGAERRQGDATPLKPTKTKSKEATPEALTKLARYATLLQTAKADRDAHDAMVAAEPEP